MWCLDFDGRGREGEECKKGGMLTEGAMIGLEESNEKPILPVSSCVTFGVEGAHGDQSFEIWNEDQRKGSEDDVVFPCSYVGMWDDGRG